jgi:hypothetical protein
MSILGLPRVLEDDVDYIRDRRLAFAEIADRVLDQQPQLRRQSTPEVVSKAWGRIRQLGQTHLLLEALRVLVERLTGFQLQLVESHTGFVDGRGIVKLKQELLLGLFPRERRIDILGEPFRDVVRQAIRQVAMPVSIDVGVVAQQGLLEPM